MGILTLQQGDGYVIASDRDAAEPPSKRCPSRRTEVCQVWTGSTWSSDSNNAIRFASLDAADEYVRANFAKVMA